MISNGNSRFQLGNVTLISVTHLLHDIYSSFLAPLRPLLIERFGVSLALASVWDLVSRLPWLLNPVIGMIAERTAARYFVIISPALTAISMSLLGVAPSFIVVVVLLIVMGISSAFFHVPSPVMIKRLSGRYTGRGMSFFMFGGEIARTLGPLVVTGAVSLWGLDGTWKLIPFGLLASLILYFRLRKINITVPHQDDNKLSTFWRTVRKMMPFLFILIGITFFRAIMKSSLTAFFANLLLPRERGNTLVRKFSTGSISACWSCGHFFSGSISDRIGRKSTLVIVSIITPVLMALFVFSSGIWSFLILLVLGIFVFAPGPVMLALVQDVSTEKPVFMNSIYMTISFMSSAVAVVFAGLLGDWLGLENTYLISSLLALGAVPFVLMLKGKKKV